MTSLKFLTATLLLAAHTLAHAGFSIQGTRVIYHEADGEATVYMQRGKGETQPVLLQAWLDDGDPMAQPGMQELPFLLTPAVSRVEADAAQVIRILRYGDLPGDRESLFYFNALEVPVKTELVPDRNRVQLAMQARMKFFYRPANLPISVDDAPKLLRFTLDAADADGQPQLRIHNPTPYYVTVIRLALYSPDTPPDAAPDSDAALAKIAEGVVAPMVPPYGEASVALLATTAAAPDATPAALPANALVRYTIINDHGGWRAQEKVLDHAS